MVRRECLKNKLILQASSYTIPRVHSLWDAILHYALKVADDRQQFINLWSGVDRMSQIYLH